ncbi:MAG: hypothetical protein RI101_01960 [Nitrospira sp.]|nr:hypothetical protein [Nitrospira sp.]
MAAVKGDKPQADLAEQFQVHPAQITEGEKQLLVQAAEARGDQPPNQAYHDHLTMQRTAAWSAIRHTHLRKRPTLFNQPKPLHSTTSSVVL